MSAELFSIIEEARAANDWSILARAIPYAKWLGIHVEKGEEGKLLSRLDYSPPLVGNPTLPAIHGGTMGALLESAAIFEVLASAEPLLLPKIITITVDYLRPARPVTTYAQGVVTRHGRRVVNVGVEAWQEDRNRPVANATVHLLVKGGDR